jgi:hypothetical protein
MKMWGVFCLIWCISEANARIIDIPDKGDSREERLGVGVSPKDEASNNGKPESSSFLRENSEGLSTSKEEIEKAEPYVIIATDKPAGPGGGLPSLDPNVIAEMVLPPFPAPELPWWERWWNGVMEWFGGEQTDSNPSEQP